MLSANSLQATPGSQATQGLAIDSQALSALKRNAKDTPQQATKAAASQFEALFMNMLLKSMRETLPGSDPLASESTKTYTSMLDSQLSQKLADKGVGLADMIVKHLERVQGKAGNAAVNKTAGAIDAANVTGNAKGAAAGDVTPASSGGPQGFVARMRGHAEDAARTLGVPAHFIVGQAALETGWGKHEIKGKDGTNSRNLFGIKAGGNWTGKTVDVLTTEYFNGVPRQVVDKFRAYDSYADAFRDYANLIGRNARYAGAAQAGADPSRFARGLAAGGYATDPQYAQKLTQVIQQTQQMQARA
jgi:flagellar protein FlgJ